MRHVSEGRLKRVVIEEESDEETSDGGVALEDLSDEDLGDSEDEDALREGRATP